MQAMPEEEEAELAASYRAKGFTHDEAARIAHRIFEDPDTALDMLVREELGLDPDELGSPWGAAGGSFVAFAIGASIPVIPYLLIGGQSALLISLGLSLVALFAVGAAVSLLTGRGLIFSGFRQLGIGLAAALVTYAIGSIIGIAAP
jgi:VIT1/CCC1 family predicted Fe2+/Mn2+ transporter